MYFLSVENDRSALVGLFMLQVNLICFIAKSGFVMSLKLSYLPVTITYYQYFLAN